MVGDVIETARRDPAGAHHHVACNRVIAIKAFTYGNPGGGGRDDIGKAPDRHVSEARLPGREEVPILHRIAKCGIGDIIRRQGEALDFEQYLTFFQRALLMLSHLGASEIGLVGEQAGNGDRSVHDDLAG